MTLKDYKLIGLLFYYGFLILFELADGYYKLNGSLRLVGRGFAVAYLVAFSFFSTDGQSLEAIKAELESSRPAAQAGGMWDVLNRAVFWGAIAFAGFFAWRGRWWDAVCALGYPVWLGWLVLEVRRLEIGAGRRKASPLWQVFIWVSLGAVVLSLGSIVVSGASSDMWTTEVVSLGAAVLCFLISFIGNGRVI